MPEQRKQHQPSMTIDEQISNLKDKGLEILSEDDLEKVESESVVIIRAHGVSPDVTKALEGLKRMEGRNNDQKNQPAPGADDAAVLGKRMDTGACSGRFC